MPRIVFMTVLCLLAATANHLRADPPVASYIFPAGAQRGKTAHFRVGGLNLHQKCSFEMLGTGVNAGPLLKRAETVWFEGPLLPLPDSQQQEDYPKDMAGTVRIAADAPLGIRYWRLWNSQGATPALKFVVGDLPEIVEDEIDGDPVPVDVKLPVTINGRIFPRENVDIWTLSARKGETICAEVNAARLGSPLDSRLEVRDPGGKVIAENDDTCGADSFVRFTAAIDGTYQVRIHDINYKGGQAYVYRLTLTSGPHVDRIYPLGGRRGGKTKFQLTGQHVPAAAEIALPASGPATLAQRLSVNGTLTNPFPIELDDLPEHLETEPNDRPEQVKSIALPAVLNGRIDKPGDVDYWAVTARKGETFAIEVAAARLGSPLHAVLSIADSSGKTLATSDGATGATDPSLSFTAPADGEYHIKIADFFHSRGGPDYSYRVRVARPVPGYRLRLAADALTVERGGEAKLHILAERLGGFNEPITLRVDGLPKDVTAQPLMIGAGQLAVDMAFKADKQAAIQPSHLKIVGVARLKDRSLTERAVLAEARGTIEVDTVLLAVALPTPFKIIGTNDMRWAPRGTVLARRYRIERAGYMGPIEVSMADHQARHLQGMKGPTITVPAGANEFAYPVFLPPWMETGRTARACVMGVATIKDERGTEHTVSFTSVQPNEQVIVVVEPGLLDVELGKDSVTAAPGQVVSFPIRVTRARALKGAVKVELIAASHLRGVTAPALTLPADKSAGLLQLHFGPRFAGPYNIPLLIRATAIENGKPVVGEAKLQLLPPR